MVIHTEEHTRQKGGPAHFEFGSGRIANAHSNCSVVMPLQVAKILCLRAQRPGEDLCEAGHGALQPQQLCELVQGQLATHRQCLGDRPLQVVVPMSYCDILQKKSY